MRVVQENLLQSFTENEVFFCLEESYFYSHCLERFVLSACVDSESIVEFGCGDETPVIHCLTRNAFSSTIHGYDLNSDACQLGKARIDQYNLLDRYKIHNESFFDAKRPQAKYLIANPPYLPALDDDIQMPLLRGGDDGAGITNQLLSLNYPTVLLMVSSYSNPVATINWGLQNDYYVADFMVTPLQFGYYSSEPKVKRTINQLKKIGKAFYSQNIYFLAGVLFKKRHRTAVDLSPELIKVMKSL